ncbi:MAG: hypothetical protein ACYTFW_09340 [Planctomycetota bacterium]|jgi:LmbE family N-acetylglucosaminyl deacetylase
MIAAVIAHPDDEVIGLFIPVTRIKMTVYALASSEERTKELRRSAVMAGFRLDISIDMNVLRRKLEASRKNIKYIFTPDPSEHHNAHRKVTSIVESLFDDPKIIYYTTDMNTDYVRELLPGLAEHKRQMLEDCYPSQKSLWEYDHKYFLFEGYRKKVLSIDDMEVLFG